MHFFDNLFKSKEAVILFSYEATRLMSLDRRITIKEAAFAHNFLANGSETVIVEVI